MKNDGYNAESARLDQRLAELRDGQPRSEVSSGGLLALCLFARLGIAAYGSIRHSGTESGEFLQARMVDEFSSLQTILKDAEVDFTLAKILAYATDRIDELEGANR